MSLNVEELDLSAESSVGADDDESLANPYTGEKLDAAPSSPEEDKRARRREQNHRAQAARAARRKAGGLGRKPSAPKAASSGAAKPLSGAAAQAVQDKVAAKYADTLMGALVAMQIKYPSMPRLTDKQMEAVIVPAMRLYARHMPDVDVDKLMHPDVLDLARLARGSYMVASDYRRVPDPVALLSALNPFGRKSQPTAPPASQPAPAASNGYAPPSVVEEPPTGEETLRNLFVAAQRGA